MKLNVEVLEAAVQEARVGLRDRILLTMSLVTYGFYRQELVEVKKRDTGRMEFEINPVIRTGYIDVANVESPVASSRRLIDCAMKSGVSHA
jgi:hypothetical protein